jgi:hypothetical protein
MHPKGLLDYSPHGISISDDEDEEVRMAMEASLIPQPSKVKFSVELDEKNDAQLIAAMRFSELEDYERQKRSHSTLCDDGVLQNGGIDSSMGDDEAAIMKAI